MNRFNKAGQKVKAFFTYYIKHRIHRKQYAEIHRLGEENARLRGKVKRILLAYGDQVGDAMNVDSGLWVEYQSECFQRDLEKSLQLYAYSDGYASRRDPNKFDGIYPQMTINPKNQFGPPIITPLSGRTSPRLHHPFERDELPPIDDSLFAKMWEDTRPIILPPPAHPLAEKYLMGIDPISSTRHSISGNPFQSFITSPKPQTDEFGHIDVDGTIAHDAELDNPGSDNNSDSNNLNKPKNQ
jgi:hypothetical protein